MHQASTLLFTPVRRTAVKYPVIHSLAHGVHASSTPTPPSQTPIKVKIALQYTRLTLEERGNLLQTGRYFRCHHLGHLDSQSP